MTSHDISINTRLSDACTSIDLGYVVFDVTHTTEIKDGIADTVLQRIEIEVTKDLRLDETERLPADLVEAMRLAIEVNEQREFDNAHDDEPDCEYELYVRGAA